jgi:hypothetical protein
MLSRVAGSFMLGQARDLHRQARKPASPQARKPADKPASENQADHGPITGEGRPTGAARRPMLSDHALERVGELGAELAPARVSTVKPDAPDAP